MIVIRNTVSKEKSNSDVNYCRYFGWTLIILFVLIFSYFAGVGLTYGFVIANNPGYNITSGCPNNYLDCPELCNSDDPACHKNIKMICYEGHMKICYAIGIATMWLIMIFLLVMILIGTVVWYLLLFLYNLCVQLKNFYNAKTQIIDATGKSHEMNTYKDVVLSKTSESNDKITTTLNDSDTIIDFKLSTSSDSSNN